MGRRSGQQETKLITVRWMENTQSAQRHTLPFASRIPTAAAAVANVSNKGQGRTGAFSPSSLQIGLVFVFGAGRECPFTMLRAVPIPPIQSNPYNWLS